VKSVPNAINCFMKGLAAISSQKKNWLVESNKKMYNDVQNVSILFEFVLKKIKFKIYNKVNN